MVWISANKQGVPVEPGGRQNSQCLSYSIVPVTVTTRLRNAGYMRIKRTLRSFLAHATGIKDFWLQALDILPIGSALRGAIRKQRWI